MTSKGRGPIKTTRLFSLQLADHDALFAPERKRRISFSWLRLVIYLPAVVFFFVPSFKIGKAVERKPGYALPDSVVRGELFTLPGEDDDIVPQISGRALAYIDAKTPVFVGVAPRASDFDISYAFNDEEHTRLKSLIEKLKHPTYPIYVKHIRVTAPPESASEKSADKKSPPAIEGAEAKILERHDGNIRLRCWKEPSVEPLGIDPLKPRRHVRLGTLPAAGGGEVVFTGTSSNGDGFEVLVYHGGGLFTRYWDLKEVRVQKGSKVSVGQTIGHVLLAPPHHATRATWYPMMNLAGTRSELTPQSVLALSTRLCDSK